MLKNSLFLQWRVFLLFKTAMLSGMNSNHDNKAPVSSENIGVQQLSDFIFFTKYARFNKDLGRRENFDEATSRVFDMHRTKFQGLGIESDIKYAESAVQDRLILGSQRAMQFGGKPILDKNARMYNCSSTYADRPRFFQESMWMLLCGVGVGFSVQKDHVNKLPPIQKPLGEPKLHKVDDSIEGWSNALGSLISSYFTKDHPHTEYAGHPVVFDYSEVRPEGAPLASGTGKAPGPAPLRRSLECIRAVFDARLAQVGSPCKLRPIDVYDIVMHSSDSVMAGGVRRSATICLFSPDDQEMSSAKTGDWFIKNPQRGRSNNSALLVRDQTTFEEFSKLIDSVKQFGEPGFVFAASKDVVYNPCAEIGMYPVDVTTGKTGWQVCNLTEINMKAVKNKEDMERACRASAILGTLQASYTDFPYLGKTSENIIRREALLGCSMTGMANNPDIAFDPQIQREMATLIKDVNADMAKKIGINPASRTTCVKPAGTTSCLFGTSSGIHPDHASRYFRRVQANFNDPGLQAIIAANPEAVEQSVWNPNGTDWVISFPIEIPPGSKVKGDMTAIDMLKNVLTTQDNWVKEGTREDRCVLKGITHNVSNTVQVKPDEWDAVAKFIYENRHSYSGVSLLPSSGDLDYAQAPFCEVLTPEEVGKRYGSAAYKVDPLLKSSLNSFGNLWTATDTARNRGEDLSSIPTLDSSDEKSIADFQIKKKLYENKLSWVRDFNKFTDEEFNGDKNTASACLKHVYLTVEWDKITKKATPVDFSAIKGGSVKEERNIEADSACAGGKCEIVKV